VKRDKRNDESVAGVGIQNQEFLVSFQRGFDKNIEFCINLIEKLAVLIQN